MNLNLNPFESITDPFGIIDFAKDQYAANRDYGHTRELFDSGNMFTERMANTAYQRAVSDMEAAGLNPMLAYQQGGAHSPGSASAPVFNRGGSSGSVQSAAQVEQLRAQTDLAKAEAAKVRAATPGVVAESSRMEQELKDAVPYRIQTAQFESEIKEAAAYLAQVEANLAGGKPNQLAMSKEIQAYFMAKFKMIPAELRQRLAEAALKELAAKVGRAADSGYESFKRGAGDLGEKLGKVTNSAVDAVRGLKHGYERFKSKAQYRRKYEFNR